MIAESLENRNRKPAPVHLRQTLSIIICVLVTLLLGISALRYVTDLWIFSFFYSFQTHFGVICAIGAILSLLIYRNWAGGILLALSLLIVAHSVVLKREFVNEIPQSAGTAKSYKLLSFNILGENLKNGKALLDMVVSSGADVVYILEAPPLQPYLAELDKTYPHRIGCGNDTPTCDLMILSKRPFVDKMVRGVSELRLDRFMMADIDLDGTVTHFAAVHLSKPYFDDYHQYELENLATMIVKDDKPLVLGGDFNASILEPDMEQFLRGADLKTAPSEPKSWPVIAGNFGIAIDHIFARAPLVLKSVRNPDSNYGSNHMGLIADFVIAK